MISDNPNKAEYPILEVMLNRWSPRTFSDNPVEETKLMTLLEAGRWAPSSYNEQPWSYVVGHKGDEIYEKLADCLAEGNAYAKNAPILMLSVAKTFFEHKHKPNRHYAHDTGMASISMAYQAVALDLYFHQMAGYDVEKARQYFGIGDDYEPMAMIAVGYPDAQHPAEKTERVRKPLEAMIWKPPTP